MRLIVGLGNPGDQYKYNRHNAGFLVVEEIAESMGVDFKIDDKNDAKTAELEETNEKVKLVLPYTFMNESGRAVGKIKNYWKIENDVIWVIHDDVDLEPGKIKVQFAGSSAGHHGIESIIENIGSDFWRIRVGVGRPQDISTERWVLMDFDNAEMTNKIIDKAAEIVLNSLKTEIKEGTIIV